MIVNDPELMLRMAAMKKLREKWAQG